MADSSLFAFIFGRQPELTKLMWTQRGIVIDASLSISTSGSSQISSFPIEGGARFQATDHVQAGNLSLSIEGIVSESPSDVVLSVLGGAAATAVSSRVGGLLGTAATTVAGSGIAAATGAIRNAFSEKAGGDIIGPQGENDWKLRQGRERLSAPEFKELEGARREGSDGALYTRKFMKALIKAWQNAEVFDIHTYFSKDIYTNMVITNLDIPQSANIGNSLQFSMTCEQIRFVQAASISQTNNPTIQNTKPSEIQSKIETTDVTDDPLGIDGDFTLDNWVDTVTDPVTGG